MLMLCKRCANVVHSLQGSVWDGRHVYTGADLSAKPCCSRDTFADAF